MHRLPAILFALAALALPTFAIPHSPRLTHADTRGQLQEVNLAEVVSTAEAQSDADGLPVRWCGDETGSNNADRTAKAQFKVVYAYAADRPDRFAGWVHALQANVAIVERFLSANDGGTKAIRFDMGTRCGPQYVDVQTVQLPGPRSSYADNFGAIAGAVQRALGAAAGPRNAIVLADGMSGGSTEYGLGETVMGASGEVSGAANVHNRGGFTSVLFSRDGAPAPGAPKWGWWPEGFLHEMTHNLGAVQWGAPHSTEPRGQQNPGYGHCWQGADVMCYLEDAGAAHAMVQDCGALPGAIPQNYDCGRDDYFSPSPAPGSYLATHWNTYDSAFLAPCGEIAPACGGGALWVPQPPAATSGPAVTGTARRGGILTVQPGSWSNGPTGYDYQWQRMMQDGWEDIADATGRSYRTTRDDLGRRLRATVIAHNEDGSSSAPSGATSPIGGSAVNRAASATSKKSKKKARAKASKRKHKHKHKASKKHKKKKKKKKR
jgi:hypothetical protein